MAMLIARELDTATGKRFLPAEGAPSVSSLRALLDRSERLIQQYGKAYAAGEQPPRRLLDEGRDVLYAIYTAREALKE